MGWLNNALDALLDAVADVEPWLRVLITSLAIALETSVLIGLVVPGDTIVLVSATGVTSWGGGIVLGVFVVAGALAGESLGFAIGRWAGPHLRASRMGRWIGEKNWQRAERYVQRRGGLAIFLSRFIPVMHSLVPLTVGMSGYRYRRFIAWTLPACVIWTALYIGIAAGAAGTYRELASELGRSAHWVGYIFVGILVAGALVLWAIKKAVHRIEARHMEHTPGEVSEPGETRYVPSDGDSGPDMTPRGEGRS